MIILAAGHWSVGIGTNVCLCPDVHSPWLLNVVSVAFSEFSRHVRHVMMGSTSRDIMRGGLRRGWLTPALGPRMNVMTKDVRKPRP